jgi:hypothetical protein
VKGALNGPIALVAPLSRAVLTVRYFFPSPEALSLGGGMLLSSTIDAELMQ